jgi:hypothetical protein
MTPKELQELNEFREKEGLPPLIRKERNCLKCQTKFLTVGHRLCNRCNIHNKSYQNADVSRFAISYTNKR